MKSATTNFRADFLFLMLECLPSECSSRHSMRTLRFTSSHFTEPSTLICTLDDISRTVLKRRSLLSIKKLHRRNLRMSHFTNQVNRFHHNFLLILVPQLFRRTVFYGKKLKARETTDFLKNYSFLVEFLFTERTLHSPQYRELYLELCNFAF